MKQKFDGAAKVGKMIFTKSRVDGALAGMTATSFMASVVELVKKRNKLLLHKMDQLSTQQTQLANQQTQLANQLKDLPKEIEKAVA